MDGVKSMSAESDADEITRNRYKTWGQPYYAALARGHDHGSAAYIADQWEARRKRNMTDEVQK